MRRILRTGLALALGLAVSTATAPADDPKPGDEKPGDEKSGTLATKPAAVDKGKGPDFSQYTFVTTVWGEVVKSNDKDVTLRIYWEHATTKNPSSGNRGRPSLYGHHNRGHHNPFTTRRPQVQVKWEHHDYTLPYVPESLVRTKTLPAKFGLDGNKVAYTAAELDALKVPYSAVGYQAAKSDLTPGTVVQASIIRDKTITAANVTDADMRIKYAVIYGHDPSPPKDITSPGSGKK